MRLRNNNSEMVPAKSGNREKVGKFVMGREVGQGKMKYLKISCCRVPSQPENIQLQNALTCILKCTSYLAPLAYMPSPIHAVLVIITGWHNQPHFTLLPTPQTKERRYSLFCAQHHVHRPPSLPLSTTILQDTGVVVLGML